MSKLAVAFDLPQTEPVETELPGNPLATELAAQMAGLGISVSDVDMHEGYGWAWLATCEDATHYIVLAPFRDGEPGLWLLRVRAAVWAGSPPQGRPLSRGRGEAERDHRSPPARDVRGHERQVGVTLRPFRGGRAALRTSICTRGPVSLV